MISFLQHATLKSAFLLTNESNYWASTAKQDKSGILHCTNSLLSENTCCFKVIDEPFWLVHMISLLSQKELWTLFKPPTLLLWSLILMMGSFFLRSQTTAFPLGLAEARMCWTCRFHETTLISSAGWKRKEKTKVVSLKQKQVYLWVLLQQIPDD